jgi:hypothetical protein
MPTFGIVPIFLEKPYIKICYQANQVNVEYMDGVFSDLTRYEHILIPETIDHKFANVIKDPKTNKLIVIKDVSKYETCHKDTLQKIREKRNILLNESDKYMLSDFPIDDTTRDSIRNYRQQLRDITKSIDDPLNHKFPELPKIN